MTFSNTHKKADSQMTIHVAHAAQEFNIILNTVDSDVVHIASHISDSIMDCLWNKQALPHHTCT